MRNKPKRIIHTGDVHLFVGKNFHIHQHVFDEFYKQIEVEKPELIVVAGDVIDSKLRLGPEQIELCRNFFLNIANYCPIILILGNHDLNMNNKERLDSLSAIIYSVYSNTKHPIHFLKESGFYNLYGIDWAVWGCLDDNLSPYVKEKDRIDSLGYTIGLFHGAIKGVVADNGFRLTEGVEVEEFEGTDVTFAADIHYQQAFRDNQIVYSGALLQVTSAEQPEGSYIVWEWNGKTYIPNLKRISNIYATLSYEIKDILTVPIFDNLYSKDQVINLRYDSSAFSKSEILNFKKELETKFENKFELKPIIKKKLLKGDDSDSFSKLDLKDLFSTYLDTYKEQLDLRAGDKELLYELDDKYSVNLDLSKDFEPGDFSILSVKLNNFLSYGPVETIFDFQQGGIYSIIGANAVGKSNCLNAIKFALFNSAPGNIASLRSLINKHNKTKPCYVELLIEKMGKYFKVKRSLLSKKKDAVSTDLDFSEVDRLGNEIKSLKGERRQETEKEMQKHFGVESFFDILSLSTALKKQVEFIDSKNAERLSLVNKFLGLQSFDEKEKEVGTDLRSKKIVYQELLRDFNESIVLSDLEKELLSKKSHWSINKPKIISYEEGIKELDVNNKELIDHYNRTKVLSEKIVTSPDEVKQKIETAAKEIKNKNEEKAIKVQKIEQLKLDLQEKKDLFFSKTKSDIKTYKIDYHAGRELQSKLSVVNADLERLNEQLKIDTCNTCGKDFSKKDKEKLKDEIAALAPMVPHYKKQIEEIEQRTATLGTIQNEYNDIGRAISNTQNEVLTLQNRIDSLHSEKEKSESKNDEYNEVVNAKELLKLLKTAYDKYLLEKAAMEKRKLELMLESKTLEESIRTLERDIKNWKEKYEKIKVIEEEVRLLKTYKDVIHKDGLPLYILKTKISLINEQINLIVNQVFEYNVEFEIDEVAGDLDIHFFYESDEEQTDAGLASGSETFIMNLCIKVGLAQISELPKIDTLFIDEGFGTLDKETVQKIPSLFNSLNLFYRNTITISHLDELKDMAAHQIKLKKVGKYTEVV